MTGTTLSHYRITAELGRGGMGIVYRAEDTKLDRTVAIKVLPSSALASEDDRARFYREAKAAAALNHPNIAQIYQIDEAVPSDAPHGTQPSPFIAMEYIDGEPLDTRIKRRPLKLVEAVRLATQIAGALGEAHEKGIVHRDVKASNVMLTSKGDAKVLDFGLALTAASTKLTRMGSTLGTVAYMSPEQARGEEVDRRTDLWALGVVLYEMVAGRNPFGGDYEQAVVYSILNAEPEPLTAVRTGVPMELERIVNKALAKDVSLRYQSAAGFVADLRALGVTGLTSGRTVSTISAAAPAATESDTPRVSIWALGAAFLLGALAVGALVATMTTGDDVPTQVYRMEVVLPTKEPITRLNISGDGSTLAYMGSTTGADFVYVHDLATGVSRALDGTDGAVVVELNDDGSTALITTAVGVNQTSTSVSAPVTLFSTQEGSPRANWAPGDMIVYEDESRIFIRDVATGERRSVILRDTIGVIDLDWPSVLPDGRTVMATIEYAGSRGLGFWDIDSGEERARIPQGGYRPQYVPSGHVIMDVGASTEPGTLVAMPFDAETLEQTGPLVPIAPGVLAEKMSVSQTGTLVYGYGRLAGFFTTADLYTLSLDGSARKLAIPSAQYNTLKLSPSGDRAVVSTVEGYSTARQGDALDTYVIDLEAQTVRALTSATTGGAADWWAGSDSVVYVDNTRRLQRDIRVVVRAADGSGSARELFTSSVGIHDIDLAPDGNHIVYSLGLSPLGATVIEVRDLEAGTVTRVSDDTPARRRRPTFSSDGSKIMYQEESVILVRSSDGTGVATRPGGSQFPAWDHTNDRIYAYGPLTMAVFVDPGTPEQVAVRAPGRVTALDVFPGGSQMLIAVESPDELQGGSGSDSDSTRTISVVLNLFEDLE